jgi:hypothetical protein
MREMVFDMINFRPQLIRGKSLSKQGPKIPTPSPLSDPVKDETEIRSRREHIGDPAQALRAAVFIDRDPIHILQANPRFPQAIGHCVKGHSRPMLDSSKALFLGGGHENPVPDDRSRGIAVKGVEAKDDQNRFSKSIESGRWTLSIALNR